MDRLSGRGNSLEITLSLNGQLDPGFTRICAIYRFHISKSIQLWKTDKCQWLMLWILHQQVYWKTKDYKFKETMFKEIVIEQKRQRLAVTEWFFKQEKICRNSFKYDSFYIKDLYIDLDM